ncbi:MAG: CDF family Co(II)/Ni(II) efflux transporter DmeF [Rhodospirillales bacterium]|nr:CDF family Co(II)/Ni(II) efflux transporter DmeF [Rhodospirillales bacterium]
MPNQTAETFRHSHVFLSTDHARSERRTWWVIWICAAMMLAEILGGWLFGSLALIADGLHMSTHAGALLLAALAYRYARHHADDSRFSFGTGKLGDLAGFTSAIILAMISLFILYEAVMRFFAPVPFHFAAAIPIACVGLVVNLASAAILSGGHDHGHDHGHHHHDHHSHHDHEHDHHHEHAHGAGARDNNMRAAITHVAADAAVSILVIAGLFAARGFGWLWMDPLVGIIGAVVIASWAVRLIRDTAGILLDMTPDAAMQKKLRDAIETEGDQLADLHLWRLGPGHFGAILSVATEMPRDAAYYRLRLSRFTSLSHLTIEVQQL